MTLTLPPDEPRWVNELAGVLSERDARQREAQAEPTPAADAALAGLRHEIGDWLSEHGRAAIRTLDARFSGAGKGYRVASETDLADGALTVALTRGAGLVMRYGFRLEALADGVRPAVTVTYGAAGRPQGRAFRARLDGAVHLADIGADDLCADFVAALAEAGV